MSEFCPVLVFVHFIKHHFKCVLKALNERGMTDTYKYTGHLQKAK